MTAKNDKCTITQLLGEVSAIITSKSAPRRHNVLWAKPHLTLPDTYVLFYWDGTEWAVLGQNGTDGLYNTLLDDNIEMPFAVGGLPAGTIVAELKGDSLISLWDRLLFPPVSVEYESPTAYISGSSPRLFKVGATASPVLNCSFDAGDAGAIQVFSLLRNDIQISASDSYTDVGVSLASPGTLVYKGKYTYAEGPILNDNHGNPSPAGHILAGSIFTADVNYKWVYPVLFGSNSTSSGIDVTEGIELLKETLSSLQITMPTNGPNYYWFAVPASAVYNHWYITDLNQGGIGSGEGWASPVPFNLTYDGFSNVPYLLYVTNFVTQFSAPILFT